jgi:SAM-dependent methyltransferase
MDGDERKRLDELLTGLVQTNLAQPATAFFRAFEICALASANIPDGLGLDIGCGEGRLTGLLLNRIGPRRLVGVDLDPLETAQAKRRPFYARVHTGSATSIPEADSTFDFAFSNSVLEHIPPLRETLTEISRLLKPNAPFFFTVPCPGFRSNLRGPLLPNISRTSYLEALDMRLAHINYLDADGWRSICADSRLTVQSCVGYIGPRVVRRWETYSRFTGGMLHAVTGGRVSPINIQRRIGLRAIQNDRIVPTAIARALSRIIWSGFSGDEIVTPWADGDNASCLLISGRKY